jgi:hypothetical protein
LTVAAGRHRRGEPAPPLDQSKSGLVAAPACGAQAEAPGNDFILLTSDEVIPGFLEVGHIPMHLVGVQTREGKLGTYSHWVPTTNEIRKLSIEVELYDYSTPRGRLELDNLAGRPLTAAGVTALIDQIVPHVLRAPLPGHLAEVSSQVLTEYLRYEAYNRLLLIPGMRDQPKSAFGGSF